MSYVPYHPEVQPPVPVEGESIRKQRSWKWPLGVFVYLLAVAGWVVWMKMPPRIQNPFAKAALPDGTELRLVHAVVGVTPGIHQGTTFQNRIRMEPANAFGSTDPNGGLWIVLTEFDPSRTRFEDARIAGAQIVEPGSPYGLYSDQVAPAGNRPYTVVHFPVVPRRLKTLEIRVNLPHRTVSLTIPNPAYVEGLPVPTAVPLPQTASAIGATVTFEDIVTNSQVPAGSFLPDMQFWPKAKATDASGRSGQYSTTHRWSDIAGKRAMTRALPWSEPVWRLEVDVEQAPDFPFSRDQISMLGQLNVPAAGQVVVLGPSPELSSKGVTQILVLGQGAYQIHDRTIQSVGKGNLGPLIPLLQAGQYRRLEASQWTVVFLERSTNYNHVDHRVLRVRKDDRLYAPSGTSTSTSSPWRDRSYTAFRTTDGATLQPGDAITLEVAFPKRGTVQFLVPRPTPKVK